MNIEDLEIPNFYLIENFEMILEKDYLFWYTDTEEWMIGYLSKKNTVLLYEYEITLPLEDFEYFSILPDRIDMNV